MILALIANISLSVLVFATVITLLVRGIRTPVSRTAQVATTTPERARRSAAGPRGADRRLDAGLSM